MKQQSSAFLILSRKVKSLAVVFGFLFICLQAVDSTNSQATVPTSTATDTLKSTAQNTETSEGKKTSNLSAESNSQPAKLSESIKKTNTTTATKPIIDSKKNTTLFKSIPPPPPPKPIELIPGKSAMYSKVMSASKSLLEDYRKSSQKTAKVSVAIMEFDSVGPAVKKLEVGDGVAEMVTSQFGKLTNAQVIDRKRMKTIMKELALSTSGLIDDTQTKQVGRILAADLILTGSVSQLGKMIQVAMRLTDVETSQQVASVTIELQSDLLVPMAQAVSVEDKFPITAAFRSLSVPGWGHFYNDQPFFGVFYLVGVAGGIGSSIFFTLQSQATYKNYNAINAVNYKDYYPTSTSPQDAAKKAFSDAASYQNIAMYDWIATGALYVANIVHAWIQAIVISERKKAFSDFDVKQVNVPVIALLPTPDGSWKLSLMASF
jgi:TolB-like protein